MRQAIAIVLLACAAGVLQSQEAGGAGAQTDTAAAAAPGAGQQAAPAGAAEQPGDADPAAEWERVRGHWALVQSLPADQKPEHLEMHREMLGGMMARLEAHAGMMKEMEARGPTVGDRMEGADREPVPGERPGEETDDAAAQAEPEGKEGERMDEARVEDEERRAGHAAMMGSLEEIREHWGMVQGIQDPAELETHLGMHMEMMAGLHEGMMKAHGGHGTPPAGAGEAGHEGMHQEPEGGAAPRPGDRPAGY
jgi:hypothetical protein